MLWTPLRLAILAIHVHIYHSGNNYATATKTDRVIESNLLSCLDSNPFREDEPEGTHEQGNRQHPGQEAPRTNHPNFNCPYNQEDGESAREGDEDVVEDWKEPPLASAGPGHKGREPNRQVPHSPYQSEGHSQQQGISDVLSMSQSTDVCPTSHEDADETKCRDDREIESVQIHGTPPQGFLSC